jgi:hypothetical protein
MNGGGGNCTRSPRSASRFASCYLRRIWVAEFALSLHGLGITGACRELAPSAAIRQGADHESGPARLNLVMRTRLPSVARVDQTDARSGDFSKAAEFSSAFGKWINPRALPRYRYPRGMIQTVPSPSPEACCE